MVWSTICVSLLLADMSAAILAEDGTFILLAATCCVDAEWSENIEVG